MSRFFSQKYANLRPYTPGEQPTDMKYVKLNTNESPFPPSPKVIEAVNGENVIYLITETEHLDLLPKGAKRIVLTADLDVIKERFKVRMRGVLPPPVEKMLENRHGIFDRTDCDILLKDGEYSKQDIIKILK